MEDHNNYSLSRQFDDSMFCANTDESAREDSSLVDLVKGYPHLYNESKDFKDVNKKNNSWEEIGRILNTRSIKYIFINIMFIMYYFPK